jgi:hypothetical protein
MTQALIAQLESARGVIETRFTDASDLLGEAIDGIAALVASLDALTHALSPAAMEDATLQLNTAAALLSALPAKQQARRAVIVQIGAGRVTLSDRIDDISRCLAYMRAYTVSIKITAGGIPQADAEFAIFAQEIGTRVAAGRAEISALEDGLATLQRELAEAAARADMLERSCAGMIPAVPDQLLASVESLASNRARRAAAATQTAALARDVRKKVTRILSALQIGDITRQRVEHIQAGLAMLEEVPAEPVRRCFFTLLAALLEGTQTDFTLETDQISAGLSGLASDAAALLTITEPAEASSGPAGFLKTLQQRMEGAAGLVREIEQADALAAQTGAQAAAAAQLLGARLQAVQAMKTDVLYMALNTTLKSARLADAGRPLATIASELRVQASALDTASGACATMLNTIIGTASGLCVDAEAGQTSAGAALRAAIAAINQASSGSGGETSALAAQGEAVQNLLHRSTGQLALQQTIGATLDQVVAGLTPLLAAGGPCDDALRPALSALFAKLGATYTMAQERDIQAAIAERFGLEIAPAVVVDELEDALF